MTERMEPWVRRPIVIFAAVTAAVIFLVIGVVLLVLLPAKREAVAAGVA